MVRKRHNHLLYVYYYFLQVSYIQKSETPLQVVQMCLLHILIKLHSHQKAHQFLFFGRVWSGKKLRALIKGPFTSESRSTPALSRSGKMDGSAMSGPWSGRAYVGLKYSEVGRARSERSWWAGLVFQPVEKWSGMIPLSTGRMLSGGTAWWSVVQHRLVIFWSGLVGDTA